MIYLAQNVDVVVVVLVFLLVLIVKDHFLFGLVDSGLEDLVRPRILLPPIILLRFVLEIVASDVGVSI